MRIFGSKTRKSSTDALMCYYENTFISDKPLCYIGVKDSANEFAYVGKHIIVEEENNLHIADKFAFLEPENFKSSVLTGFFIDRNSYNNIINGIIDIKTFMKCFNEIKEIE